jgi:hypothetical protein
MSYASGDQLGAITERRNYTTVNVSVRQTHLEG